MNLQEYMSAVLAPQRPQQYERILMAGMNWTVVPDMGVGIHMNPTFIGKIDNNVGINDINCYVAAIKAELMRRYAGGLIGMTLKTGIAVVASENEIPEATKLLVSQHKFGSAWSGIFVLPVLVDLSREDVTTLKRPGFLWHFPVKRNILFARERFTLEGRLASNS